MMLFGFYDQYKKSFLRGQPHIPTQLEALLWIAVAPIARCEDFDWQTNAKFFDAQYQTYTQGVLQYKFNETIFPCSS